MGCPLQSIPQMTRGRESRFRGAGLTQQGTRSRNGSLPFSPLGRLSCPLFLDRLNPVRLEGRLKAVYANIPLPLDLMFRINTRATRLFACRNELTDGEAP